MRRAGMIAAAVLALAACNQNDRRQPVTSPKEAGPPIPPPATGPDARTPLGRPKPAIDPKSTEAAEELVGVFAGLLNARKFDEAYMLLGPDAPPRRDFDEWFARYSRLSAAPGTAGGQEGAAGSIYLSVPLTISGTISGKRVSRSATAILRRVNDVPGSTERQRRWHIERIDWKDPA